MFFFAHIVFSFFSFLKKIRQTAVGNQRTILQCYDAGKMDFTALLYYFTTTRGGMNCNVLLCVAMRGVGIHLIAACKQEGVEK
jgi:hypothetical protein